MTSTWPGVIGLTHHESTVGDRPGEPQGQVADREPEMWDADFLDMREPAYITCEGKTGGQFAFGGVTGQLHRRETGNGVDFTWQGRQ